MQERILPYKNFAWEKGLIEYDGTLIQESGQFFQYTSPGTTIYRAGLGEYLIYLEDKVPVWDEILNGFSTNQNLKALDSGFGSTLQCFTQVRRVALGDKVNIHNSSAYFVTPGEKQIAFKVFTYNNNVPSDNSFCFKIILTSQPTKYVPGLGA